MSALIRGALRGAAAGASGTTALNTLTYLDMVARARPASTTPEATVEELSKRTGVDVPGEGQNRDNRVAGLGLNNRPRKTLGLRSPAAALAQLHSKNS